MIQSFVVAMWILYLSNTNVLKHTNMCSLWLPILQALDYGRFPQLFWSVDHVLIQGYGWVVCALLWLLHLVSFVLNSDMYFSALLSHGLLNDLLGAVLTTKDCHP